MQARLGRFSSPAGATGGGGGGGGAAPFAVSPSAPLGSAARLPPVPAAHGPLPVPRPPAVPRPPPTASASHSPLPPIASPAAAREAAGPP